jgi:hypothetical protein
VLHSSTIFGFNPTSDQDQEMFSRLPGKVANANGISSLLTALLAQRSEILRWL